MTVTTAAEVLDFWFSDQMQPYWFAKSDQIDAQISQRFADTYQAAHDGQLDGWIKDADSALALCIVLDQFPRNMFRGSPRSFESNRIALDHARKALELGHDQAQDPTRRQFFYLPFMHSEDLADQTTSVRLYEIWATSIRCISRANTATSSNGSAAFRTATPCWAATAPPRKRSSWKPTRGSDAGRGGAKGLDRAPCPAL